MHDPLPPIYRFGLRLSKSYTTVERGETLYLMEGDASDERPDQQRETLIQAGMDFTPLMEQGIVNWDHEKGPENIIGEPVLAEIRPGPRFFVRASMYVTHKERARHAWETAEAMQKAGGRRRLGWSVEGAIIERDPIAPRRIVQSEVRHLALTHQPVNANSWAAIVKSMTTATAAPIQLENLDQQVTSVLWGACASDRCCYGPNGYFYGGRGGALEHLVKCRGMAVEPATRLIKRLIDSGI